MADDTMVAKVAEAIKKTGDAQSEYYWNDMPYAGLARAALAAMREPTSAMTDVGSCVVHENDLGQSACLSASEAGEVWAAMIDAALGEKTGTHE